MPQPKFPDEVISNYPLLSDLPDIPYVSSGDPLNSIVRLVGDVNGEVFEQGAITVTCFGRASVQPWRFFYGRMAILKRLKRIKLVAPNEKMMDGDKSIAEKVTELSQKVIKILVE